MIERIVSPKSNGLARKAAGAALAALIASYCMLPTSAFAEVRKADIIGDSTVDALGLTVAQCPNIDAQYACLMDGEGTIYFQRDATTSSTIASVTKIMTAIVACENADTSASIIVSAEAAEIGESSAGLQEGDAMDFDTALKALLVPSGNDAAIALAQTVGQQMINKDASLGTDPIQVFVDAMNKKAAELGCQNTVYENPHGLDYDEYAGNLHSDAIDQALIGRYAMSITKIKNIVGGGSTTITVTRDNAPVEIELETTDLLLDWYEYATGIKTGMTESAGYCFSGAANNGVFDLYAVVLNSSSSEQRFYDAEALLEWGYEHIVDYKLANSPLQASMTVNGQTSQVPVIAKAAHADWTDVTVDVTLAEPNKQVRLFDLNGNVSQEIELDEIRGNVKAGDKVGTIRFYQHNSVIETMDLVACRDVSAPNPIEWLGITWTRLTAGFTGAQTVAETEIYNTMALLNNKQSDAS